MVSLHDSDKKRFFIVHKKINEIPNLHRSQIFPEPENDDRSTELRQYEGKKKIVETRSVLPCREFLFIFFKLENEYSLRDRKFPNNYSSGTESLKKEPFSAKTSIFLIKPHEKKISKGDKSDNFPKADHLETKIGNNR